MTDQWWVSLQKNGRVDEQVVSEKRPRGRGWHKVDRVGDLRIETWRPRHGWVPLDEDALHDAVDGGHAADHGPWRIALDRGLKEIEARIMLGGTPIPGGRVEQEAAILERDPLDLARDIVAKADAAMPDLERIAAKAKIRATPPARK